MSKKASEKITSLVQDKGKDGKILNLGKNVGVADAKEVAVALQYIPGLTVLDLEKNDFEDDGVALIMEQIAKHAKGLKILSIAQNRVSRLDQILPVFQNCPSLATLDASTNTLWIGGVESLMDAISKFGRSLTKIRLSNNSLRSVDARLIANAFPGCPLLDSLELGNNRIGDDGARFIFEGLVQNARTLTTLQLNNNNIGPNGARYMAAGLPAQLSLNTLLLDGNPLGDAGVETIANVLGDCPSLSLLALSEVGLTAVGAKALHTGLGNCPSLIWLNTDKNGLDEATVQSITADIKKNEEPARKQQAAAKRKQALQSAQMAQELRDRARKAIREVEETIKKAGTA